MDTLLPAWGTAGHPDQIVFRTNLVTIGAFRCDVDNPCFASSGPILQPCFAFPRTAVALEYPDRPEFIADPTVVTLFNAGQTYRRRALDPSGDRCDWYGVDPLLFREVLRPIDPAAADEPDRPVSRPFVASSSPLYLRQRRFFTALRTDPVPDQLAVEETVCSVLNDVLASARGERRTSSADTSTRRQRADVVDAARRMLARRFRDPLSLSAVAEATGTLPFQLCRAFRSILGVTLHRYRGLLRLRASLELIEENVALTEIALTVGYSSHSHFTAAFRAEFGVPPSRAECRMLRARRVWQEPVVAYR